MKENDSSNKSQTNNENEPIPGGVNPLYYHSLKQKMNIDYSDFDAQKGNLSPRYLFKKRKNDSDSGQKMKNETKDRQSTNKVENRLKESFDNFMDFVHDTYFYSNSRQNSSDNTNFKFTSLDLLLNPLRQKFTWETWSPYEIALFHCCICKFGPNFDFFQEIVSIFINNYIDKDKNKGRDH